MLTTATGVFLGLLTFAILIGYLHSPSWLAMDDTDAPGGKRSGMVVLTDHKTGVQYLLVPLGGMTVRLDKDGKPVTIKD